MWPRRAGLVVCDGADGGGRAVSGVDRRSRKSKGVDENEARRSRNLVLRQLLGERHRELDRAGRDRKHGGADGGHRLLAREGVAAAAFGFRVERGQSLCPWRWWP